jgi:hypothetical protein
MEWRAASAAYEAGCLADWFDLPAWHKAWIIAAVETKSDISNAVYGDKD